MIHGINIEVDCVDDGDDTYYELYDGDDCINLGVPFYEKPTETQIKEFLIKEKILQDHV
jgi:hypothetical protein